MSAFSALNLFKSQSKSIAKQNGEKLSVARERLAINAGYSSYHELQTTADQHLEDTRLLRTVFGESRLIDVAFQPQVLQFLKNEVSLGVTKEMSVPTSITLSMGNPGNLFAMYKADVGVMIIAATAEVEGVEQFPNGMSLHWFFAAFHFEVKYRNGLWAFVQNSVGIKSIQTQPDEVDDNDDGFITEFPPTDFWD